MIQTITFSGFPFFLFFSSSSSSSFGLWLFQVESQREWEINRTNERKKERKISLRFQIPTNLISTCIYNSPQCFLLQRLHHKWFFLIIFKRELIDNCMCHLIILFFSFFNRWNFHEGAAGSWGQSCSRTANRGERPRKSAAECQSHRPSDGHWRQRQHAGHRRAGRDGVERSRRTSCRHGSGAHPGRRYGRRQQRLHHLFVRHWWVLSFTLFKFGFGF